MTGSRDSEDDALLPPAVTTVVRFATNDDRRRRPPTAAAMLQLLDSAAARLDAGLSKMAARAGVRVVTPTHCPRLEVYRPPAGDEYDPRA